jgi:hypothetical protein
MVVVYASFIVPHSMAPHAAMAYVLTACATAVLTTRWTPTGRVLTVMPSTTVQTARWSARLASTETAAAATEEQVPAYVILGIGANSANMFVPEGRQRHVHYMAPAMLTQGCASASTTPLTDFTKERVAARAFSIIRL